MPTVTVTEFAVNEEFYRGESVQYYPFSSRQVGHSGTVRRMTWAGDTENAVGTYNGATSIRANSNFIYNATDCELIVGDPTESYLGYSYTFTIGGTDLDNISAIEIVGYKDENGTVGSLSFHNVAASQSNKMIAQIYAQRDDNHDYGALNINVAGTAGASWVAARIERSAHRWYISNVEELVLNATTLRPYTDGGLTLGSAGTRFAYAYLDNLNVNESIYVGDIYTYISQDSAGNLIFKDAVGGPYELSELAAAGGGGVTFGSENQIPATNAGTNDFDYSANFTFNSGTNVLTVDGTILTDVLQIEDSNTYIAEDSAGNMIFYDANVGYPVELGELIAGGAGQWSRSGTDLSPTNAGDDVLLATNTERIRFGDGDTDIYESSDDDLAIRTGGASALTIGNINISVFRDVIPNGTSYDLGNSTNYFAEIWGETFYLDSNTYLTIDSAGNLIFKDTNGGPYELSELAAGGGGGTIDGSGAAGELARWVDSNTLTNDDLSGDVATSGSLVTVLQVSAITDRTALTSGLASTDELLVNDAGSLKRMDISVLETYMQNNLDFNVDVQSTPQANYMVTWVDADTIKQGILRQDVDDVLLGSTTNFTVADYAFQVGNFSAGYYGQLALLGNQTTDVEECGVLSFHNYASSATNKKVGEIRVNRDGDDDAAAMRMGVTDNDGNLETSLLIANDQIAFRIEDTTELVLDSSLLRPSGGGNLSLGDNTNYFQNAFVNSLRIKGQSGFGTQMLVCNNSGDVSHDDIPAPVLGDMAGVLYTKSDGTAYSTTGSNEQAGDLVTCSNANYEGDADGSRLFRWTLGGKYGANTNDSVVFRFYLGATLLFNFSMGNSTLCNFNITALFGAYSGTYSRASVRIDTDDFGGTAFTYDAITHGTGSNLSVYVHHSADAGDNPYVYVYHQTIEVLEV